jgi:hypothetical protein
MLRSVGVCGALFLYLVSVPRTTLEGKREIMNLKELIGKLPEADRSEGEKAIQEAITASNPVAAIATREAAFEFITKNGFFKAALDEEIRSKVADHDTRFVKEKLPGLVDAKIKELNPPSDPRDIEIADIKKQLAERDRKELLAKQREIALKLAASEGIPVDDIERFIGDDDTKTTESVKAYAARVKAFRDAGVESALKERLGNNGSPRNGNVAAPTDLQSQYDAAIKAGNADLALAIQSKMQAVTE